MLEHGKTKSTNAVLVWKWNQEKTMGYAELLQKLQNLPEAKQAEVFDFVEFLTARNQETSAEAEHLEDSPLARLMRDPLTVEDFIPLSREDANARQSLR